MLARFGHQVVAVDIIKNSIGYAKKLATSCNCIDKIDFRGMDVSQLSFDSYSFDIVTGEDALHHIIKYPGAIENIYRVLKPGGKAYFSEPFAFNLFIQDILTPLPEATSPKSNRRTDYNERLKTF